MIAFIEEHREANGVKSVRRVLLIAPLTYYAHAAIARNPGKASDQSKRDAETLKTIQSRPQGKHRAVRSAQGLAPIVSEGGWPARCTLE